MKYGIFLDDERKPEDVSWLQYPVGIQWVVVRNDYEFFKELTKVSLKDLVLSFDHDLGICQGANEVTGYTILRELCVFLDKIEVRDFPEFVAHSQNPIGAMNMRSYWNNYIDFRKLQFDD